MSTLTSYNGLEVVTPSPLAGAGGAAINDNFIALSTKIATTIPGPTDDSDSGYSEGSRWYDSGTTAEWVCTDATPGAAMWKAIASAAYLALGGGTMSGTIEMAGNNLNLNTGAGSGGGNINADGGNLLNVTTAVAYQFLSNRVGNGSSADGLYLAPYSSSYNISFRSDFFGTFTELARIKGTGGLQNLGNGIDMNTGAGTGGGDINMDSGNIANCSSIGGPGGFIGIAGPPASATWTATINGHTNIIGELLVNNILQDTGVRNSFYCTSITQLTGDSDVTLAINAFSSPPYALTAG
ncbi:MAG TPA: hypothetical protein VFE47_07705 [Tepidisphaeraceae bacterium]|jgi:hypothetical protein|nr:hypothetical protein [Tepidisphaeraceae bacterium]